MGARRRDVVLAGAAALAMAMVLIGGDGVDVGAGTRRSAPAPPSVVSVDNAVTVDNPITGAALPDAVYQGAVAPKAVVIVSGATSSAGSDPVTWESPAAVVLSA